MDLIPALRTFATVAEQGSFTQAAQQLELSRATASKQIAFLERYYGARLLRRTTRRLSLTDDGCALQRRAIDILAEIDALDDVFQQRAVEPQGRLRVSAPLYVGEHYLSPAMARLAAEWPGLQLDIDLTDRRIDLIEEGYDLVVRIGELRDSSLISRKLGETGVALVASPAYLQRYGTPAQPADLARHEMLWYRYGQSVFTGTLDLRRQAEPHYRTNSGAVLRDLALAGHGIALLPNFLIGDALDTNQLVSVLPEHTQLRLGIYAIYVGTRRASARLNVAIDALIEAFADFR
tara:strand:- start:1420 stop:2295 length:876 start_codon:yes stop_codon:yes gene_type:complete